MTLYLMGQVGESAEFRGVVVECPLPAPISLHVTTRCYSEAATVEARG